MGILTETFTAGSPASPGAARQVPNRPGASGGEISEKQKETVRTMQQLMGKLNEDLQSDEIASVALRSLSRDGKLPEKYQTVDSLKQVARSWGSTSAGGYGSPVDGIWGPATKAALERIKNFITEAGIQGIILNPGSGQRPYREMQDSSVIKTAEDNITNLARLFTAFGMKAPAAAQRRSGEGFILDQVPEVLTNANATAENPWPEYWGSKPVTAGDLKSFEKFFLMIQGLTFTECRPLEGKDREDKTEHTDRFERKTKLSVENIQKITKEILEGSIWKLGQEPAKIDPAEIEAQDKNIETEQVPESPAEGGHWLCFYTIDDVFWWFRNRSAMIYAELYRLSQEARPHPAPGREGTPISDQDLRASLAYQSAITELWREWSRMKPGIIKMIHERNSEDNPKVTFDMILRAERGDLAETGGPGGPGAARRTPGGGGYTIPGGGESYEDRALRGPIREFMPLNWLLASDNFNAGDAGIELETLSGGRLPDINRRTWRSGDWVSIALANIEGDTDTERLRAFPRWARLVRDAIRNLYVNWEYDYRSELDPNVIAQQNREWARWNSVIRSLIARSQRGMARALSRV